MIKVMATVFRVGVRRAIVGPHPFGNPSNTDVMDRARTGAGRDGSSFEQILQIPVAVAPQSAHRDALSVALQFASTIAVLAAVVSLDGEATVGPQLPFGTETVWGLQ